MKRIAMYTVMIASPNDVQEERAATEDVVRKYNAEVRHSKSNHRLETGRWELDTALGIADDVQDLIDEDVTNTADLVVGIFSTRLGTASGKDASYTIGELKRCAEANKPVLILFNDADIPRTADMNELERVKDFRSNTKKYLGKPALYATYRGIDNFREVFRNQITSAMNKLLRDSSPELEALVSNVVNLDFLISEANTLLSMDVIHTTQQFVLWKNLLDDYLKEVYGENSPIWKVYSQISFSGGSYTWGVEASECHKGLSAVKTLLLQLSKTA